MFITPLQLDQLAADNRTCSICFEPYIEAPSPGCTRDHEPGEWAVRIDMVAEPSSLRRGCRHIIGKECLGAHLQSPGPWKSRCPICRDVWFHEAIPTNRVIQQPRQVQATPSGRRATRSVVQTATNGDRHGHAVGSLTCLEQRMMQRNNCTSFLQQVRETLQIADESTDAGQSLEEVEQRLKIRLYGQPANTADPSG